MKTHFAHAGLLTGDLEMIGKGAGVDRDDAVCAAGGDHEGNLFGHLDLAVAGIRLRALECFPLQGADTGLSDMEDAAGQAVLCQRQDLGTAKPKPGGKHDGSSGIAVRRGDKRLDFLCGGDDDLRLDLLREGDGVVFGVCVRLDGGLEEGKGIAHSFWGVGF